MNLAPMADLTMCSDVCCPRRDLCHRYTATAQPHGWQSWYPTTPRDVRTGECSEFLPNATTERKRK